MESKTEAGREPEDAGWLIGGDEMLANMRRELKAEQERSYAILESISDAFLAIDRQWQVTYANKKMLNFAGLAAAEAMVGRSIWEIFPRLVNSPVEVAYRRAMDEQLPSHFQVQGSQSSNWYETSIYPATDGIFIFGRDITERKLAERALQESEARLRELNQTLEQRVAERTTEMERSLEELHQFNYVVSHDLKAPLRAVKYLAQWIVEDADDVLPEASRLHLAKLQGRIQRMEKFLDDLLIYSRLGHGYLKGIESVDTRALIEEVIELLAPPSSFTFVVQEELPTLMTHRMLLELVFKNLIENGIKHHHRQKGQIEISAQEADDFIQFAISDDGPGINEQYHERIFQIFQTLRPRDQVEGTGAGLALVKKAVESQGGTIKVISAEGQGTTFHFTWPKG